MFCSIELNWKCPHWIQESDHFQYKRIPSVAPTSMWNEPVAGLYKRWAHSTENSFQNSKYSVCKIKFAVYNWKYIGRTACANCMCIVHAFFVLLFASAKNQIHENCDWTRQIIFKNPTHIKKKRSRFRDVKVANLQSFIDLIVFNAVGVHFILLISVETMKREGFICMRGCIVMYVEWFWLICSCLRIDANKMKCPSNECLMRSSTIRFVVGSLCA